MLLRWSQHPIAPPAGQLAYAANQPHRTLCWGHASQFTLVHKPSAVSLHPLSRRPQRACSWCTGDARQLWASSLTRIGHCRTTPLPRRVCKQSLKVSQSSGGPAGSTNTSSSSSSSSSKGGGSSSSGSSIRYRCPTCGAPLLPEGLGLGCAEGHWVGRAKEGHVHLLPAGRKRALHASGDSDAMVRARRAFFDAGHYSSVADAVAQAVSQAALAPHPAPASPRPAPAIAAAAGTPALPVSTGDGTAPGGASTDMLGPAAALGLAAGDDSALPAPVGYAPGQQASACLQPVRVLDAGCGEGRYLGCIMEGLRPECHGIDVSKTAVRLAARRYPDAAFAVASSYQLPYDDAVFDVVVSVFSPTPVGEFRRVTRRGGTLVVASPGRDHLASIKRLLYRVPRAYEERALEGPLQSQVRVREELTVGGADALKLLAMTPYYWKASQQQQLDLAGLDTLTTTVDIIVSNYLL